MAESIHEISGAEWAARAEKVLGSRSTPPRGMPPKAVYVRGKGSTVWDVDGKAFIDAHGGAWLNGIGHGRAEVAEIAASQMSTLAHYNIAMNCTNIPAIELSEALLARAPGNLDRVRLVSSGSEADDAAFQLARYYYHQKGQKNRTRVLSIKGCFHGGSYGGVEIVGGDEGIGASTDTALLLTPPITFLSDLFDGENPTDYCIRELEQTIAAAGAETICAMFGEPVMGLAGMIPLPDDYWPRVAEVLKKHDILLVMDEVVTAFGRSGEWFLCNEMAVEPNILVLAKGITSGYAPLGAILMDREVADAVANCDAGISSCSGHPVACSVAKANIDIIERENLLAAAQRRGQQFIEELQPLMNVPIVGEVRGKGLIAAVSLVVDKLSKVPLFDKFPPLKGEILQRLKDEYSILASVHSGALSSISVTPPLVITETEVTRVAAAISDIVRRINPQTGEISPAQ